MTFRFYIRNVEPRKGVEAVIKYKWKMRKWKSEYLGKRTCPEDVSWNTNPKRKPGLHSFFKHKVF
jgi:hypothetical protein